MAIYQYQHKNYFKDPIKNALSAASSVSNIKSARLSRERNELAMEKEQAGIKLRELALDEESDLLVDESMQGEGEGEYAISDPMSQKEINRLQALAPEVSKELRQTRQQAQQQESMVKYFEAKGASKDEATLRASGYYKEIDNFEKAMRTKSDVEKKKVEGAIASQGKSIQNVLEISSKNPQLANRMFLDYRAGSEDKVKTLLRDGNIKGADIVQEELNKMPNSLIKPDGSFDAEFLMLKLGQYSEMLATKKSFTKEQQSKTKQENLLALEEEKQEGRVELEKEKAKTKTTSKVGSSDFERVLASLNLTDAEKRVYKKAWLTKKTQPSMNSLLVSMNTVKKEQEDFASSVGLDDPFKLATVDTRQWTPEQQAQGNQVASVIIKGLGANAKAAEKKMGEYGALSDQMQNAISSYENVGNFRTADETVKKYFSNYFGLSESELESTEAAQAFQSMLNIKIKADSGSAVSGQEMVRNTLETASPFMTKEKILLGIKNVAKRYAGELKSLKKVMGPVAFNLKYGTTLSNYEEIAKATDTKEAKKKETQQERLKRLENKKSGSREEMFNKIKTQRPNATPEQINAYLTSKGY